MRTPLTVVRILVSILLLYLVSLCALASPGNLTMGCAEINSYKGYHKMRLSSPGAETKTHASILKNSKALCAETETPWELQNITEEPTTEKARVTLETSLPAGSKIKLTLWYNGELTISGIEETPKNGVEKEYTLTGQSVLLEGNLTELYCAGAQITTLTLSKCDELVVLDCSSNQIKALDLSEAPHLEILVCSDNELSSLDIPETPDLMKLWCSNNEEIQSLDLAHCGNLIALWCYGCNLSELDLSACTSLTGVDCMKNKLTKLNLGNLDGLTRIACANNRLRQIDLSGVPNVEELLCGDNQLTSLELTPTPYLVTLKCPNNQLGTLDLSHLTLLETVHCQRNQLKTLDLSKNEALEELYCYENQIKGDAMRTFVTSLRKIPQDGYESLMIINSTAPEEQNRPMESDIALARAKGWTPKHYRGGINDGSGVPFDGFNGITPIAQVNDLQISLLDDRTLIVRCGDDQLLTLYAVDGSIIYRAENTGRDRHYIRLPHTTSGTIIVRLGDAVWKILLP